MPRRKRKTERISIFKGREARLNRAIIQVLAKREPQSTWELRKKILQTRGMKHISYSTVNKRVRNLEQSGYLRKAIVKERVGGITNYYELRPKAYLATFFSVNSIEDLLDQVNDTNAFAILGAMFSVIESETKMYAKN